VRVDAVTNGDGYWCRVNGREVCYNATLENASIAIAVTLRCPAADVLPFLRALGGLVE
jgi:hypothetical protein